MDKRLIAIAISAVGLSGCVTIADTPSGVHPLLVANQLQFLDVAAIIEIESGGTMDSAEQKAASDLAQVSGSNSGRAIEDRGVTMRAASQEDIRVARAIKDFYDRLGNDPATIDSPRLALIRNDIQDQIVSASNQRCLRWKNYFANEASEVGFFTSTISAGASSASTALTGAAAKATSAASTLFSAADSKYSERFLQSKSAFVIEQGIDTRRATIYAAMTQKRLTNGNLTPLSQYTLSAAIADALEYHGACSVASGLQQASEAMAQQPGGPSTSAEGQKADDAGPAAPGPAPAGPGAPAHAPVAKAAKKAPAPAPAAAPPACGSPKTLPGTKSPAAVGLPLC